MQFSALSAAFTIALVSATPQYGEGSISSWHPAGPNDFRGPCPMMNTLANHGFLPRDGRNLTKANVVKGLGDGLNFDPTLAGIMWDQAIIANPEPNATFFTLDNLNRHNVLEHDASMSRSDAFFGNNHVFNQTVFDTTTVYWTASTLDAKQLTNGKLFRQIDSRASNPNYTFTASTENFSVGEVAAPIIVFGDMDAGTVAKDLVVYFFENEKLPSELGWTKKADPVTLDNIMQVSSIIANATSLFTGTSSEHTVTKRKDLHAGLSF
ncbi:Chloroperoxidase [Lophiotrema nucula]|uniref:Chloroperoxidase n=1 Tax=Lophiotrema nucula TaxID=690887 RepID=A0A6A5YX46_9PLEO|nr:Chloroperoxidase [Lophiotrema nucula]